MTTKDQIQQAHQALEADRSPWLGFWEELGRAVQPRKSRITGVSDGPTTEDQDLYDSTATQACLTLAMGHLALVHPQEEAWFSFSPPEEFADDDEAVSWYRRGSEILLSHLARSNFYTEIHETALDRSGFGSCAIYCAEGKRSSLYFRNIPVGGFCFAEDDEGLVDTLHREFRWTARQAAERFGADQLSPKMAEALKDPKKAALKFAVVHCVYPRPAKDRDERKADALNKPWASVYAVKDDGYFILSESGYDEFPFGTGRYLTWSDHVYGWCPAWAALADVRQLNFLAKMGDALAEVAAFPRILSPAGMVDEIDLRAAGVTTFDPSKSQEIPREWATAGRYDIGKDRENMRRERINEAFHVDLFRMFAGLDRQMTAREVAERAQEKLMAASPTFSRYMAETLPPVLNRAFAILLRAGIIPPPPQSIMQPDEGGFTIPDPRPQYHGRIALAMRELSNIALTRSMENLAPLGQLVGPSILDSLNTSKAVPDFIRNSGVPEKWIRSEKEVTQMQQARQAEAQRQQQMAEAAAMADGAAKLGRVPPENLEKLQEAVQQ